MSAPRRIQEVAWTDDAGGSAVWLRTGPVETGSYVAFVAANSAAIDRDLSHYIELDAQRIAAFDAVLDVEEGELDNRLTLRVKECIDHSGEIVLLFATASERTEVAKFIRNGLK
ncbi:MAG: hypothetical protein IV086_16410 [Hyphomonadaceae bacterium]|nr:hypothetical protein [Hyphomonadaceae bacterium]